MKEQRSVNPFLSVISDGYSLTIDDDRNQEAILKLNFQFSNEETALLDGSNVEAVGNDKTTANNDLGNSNVFLIEPDSLVLSNDDNPFKRHN